MENSRPVIRIDQNLHRQSDRSGAGPFDINTPLGFVHQALDVRTHLGMDGNPFATSNIAYDSLAPDRIAALSAIDQNVIRALDSDSQIAVRPVRFGRQRGR